MSDARQIVIRVKGASKTYRVYRHFGRGWIASLLMPFAAKGRFYDDLEALKPIDLDIEHGEVLGVLGPNGAGKSTLLKLVAGLAAPTSGSVEVNGDIRALLTLGVGFHPRFTGRENIIFGSLAMGVRKQVAYERMDEIMDFAELGTAIDMPVQFYSSGMRARLAAAVAFQEAAPVLIVDEALAAGDGYFISKCMQRISEICQSGSTVLFVSHGTNLIERFCSRAIIIDEGVKIADGPAAEIAAKYRQMLLEKEQAQLHAADSVRAGAAIEGTLAGADDLVDTECFVSGKGTIELMDAWMCGSDGTRRRVFDHGEHVEMRIRLRTKEPIETARFHLQLFSEYYGAMIAEFGSDHLSATTGQLEQMFLENVDGAYELRMTWPSNPLGGGPYYWSLNVAPPAREMSHDSAALYHIKVDRLCPFHSVSFPGHAWAKSRRSVLEPETDLAWTRLDGVQLRDEVSHAGT